MEKVWEEAGLVASRRTSTGDASSHSESENQQDNFAPPPPAPPLRGRFGKLWERASSLGAGVVEKVSTTGPEKDRKNEEDAKRLPSPPPEPEEIPPKRFVPPLPPARTQAPVLPHSPPRGQNGVETATPPVEASIPLPQDGVLFEHDHHDHPQHAGPPSERSIPPSEAEKPESVVEKPKPPVLPPRAPRHPPADIVRPGTPSAIPLPDSRPSTPAPASKAERRTSLPSTPTKSDRSSSPVPGSGGVPPPIPRRAPARVRPVSVSLRPSTPLNQPPINPLEEKDEAKELGTDPQPTISEPANPIEWATPPPAVETVSRQTPDSETPQNAEQSSPIAMADGSAASPVDNVPHAIGDDSGLLNHQNLVGDKSWEDKTWKEVVRLREEMFYARLGVIR